MADLEFRERCAAASRQTDDALLRQVCGEFREWPALRLSVEQAMRLWSLDRSTCNWLLNSLAAAHFLERDGNGRYAKAP